MPDRVINTQDIFHAALLPAGVFLVLCIAVAWFVGRTAIRMAEPEPLTVGQGILAGFSLAALLLLLGGVATGYFYAVEAAAVGAFALLVAGLLTGRLQRPGIAVAFTRCDRHYRRIVLLTDGGDHFHTSSTTSRHRPPGQQSCRRYPGRRPTCRR